MYTMYSCKGHASGFKKQAICVKIRQKTRLKRKYSERIRNVQVSTKAGRETCHSWRDCSTNTIKISCLSTSNYQQYWNAAICTIHTIHSNASTIVLIRTPLQSSSGDLRWRRTFDVLKVWVQYQTKSTKQFVPTVAEESVETADQHKGQGHWKDVVRGTHRWLHGWNISIFCKPSRKRRKSHCFQHFTQTRCIQKTLECFCDNSENIFH